MIDHHIDYNTWTCLERPYSLFYSKYIDRNRLAELNNITYDFLSNCQCKFYMDVFVIWFENIEEAMKLKLLIQL